MNCTHNIYKKNYRHYFKTFEKKLRDISAIFGKEHHVVLIITTNSSLKNNEKNLIFFGCQDLIS